MFESFRAGRWVKLRRPGDFCHRQCSMTTMSDEVVFTKLDVALCRTSMLVLNQEERKSMSQKLFVGNLPWAVNGADLETILGENGLSFVQVEVLYDRETNRSRGFGFVHFANEEDAMRAKQVLGGLLLRGRELVVNDAISERPGQRRHEGGSPKRNDRERGRRGRERRHEDDWGRR
jgi:cold-inducible RNA-binding protein